MGLSRVDFWPFFIKRGTKNFSDWFENKEPRQKCSVSSPQVLIEYYDKWLLVMRHYPGESFGLPFNPSESEPSWAIPKSVSELFGIIPNQPKKHFVSCMIKIGWK